MTKLGLKGKIRADGPTVLFRVEYLDEMPTPHTRPVRHTRASRFVGNICDNLVLVFRTTDRRERERERRKKREMENYSFY